MTKKILDLSVLPESAREEVIDFYEFLKMKYDKENREINKIEWEKLIPREVEPFKPMTRDDIYAR